MTAKKPKSEHKTNGAPTKYKKSNNDLVYKLCLLGSTDKQIADILDIAVSTLNLWKDKHPSFMDSIKKGKHDADANIVESLYKRALGYTVTETKEEDGTNGKKTTVASKHIPGDTTSAIFWLKNRQPEKWRDKVHTDNVNHNIEYAELSDDELDRKLSRLES